jgi:hypothetical protein
MNWAFDWFFVTSIVCTYPVWAVVMMFGAAVPPGAEGLKWALDFTTRNGVAGFVVGAPAMLLLYIIWPVMMAFIYGCRVAPMLGTGPAVLLNLCVVALIGSGVGFYLANKFLARIDAKFGLQFGFGTAAKVYAALGASYTAIKLVKGGARAIRKI